jgi:hypothetical protein
MAIDIYQQLNTSPPRSMPTTDGNAAVDIYQQLNVDPKASKDEGFNVGKELMGFGQNFLGGVARSVIDPAIGITQAIAPKDAPIQQTLKQYHDTLEERSPTFSAGGLLGQTVGTLAVPGGLVAKGVEKALPVVKGILEAPGLGGGLARVGSSVGKGAALGASEYVDPDADIGRLAQAGVGGLLGGLGGAAIEGIGAARKGFRPLEQELGQDLTKMVDKKDQILNEVSAAKTQLAAGEDVRGQLTKLDDKLYKNYDDLYNLSKTQGGGDLLVADSNITKAYIDNQKAFQDKVPKPIQKELSKYKLFNLESGPSTPGEAANYLAKAANPKTQSKLPQDLTVSDALDLVKTVNARIRKTTDGAEYSALANVRNSLYEAIDSAGQKSDMAKTFLQARDARVAYKNVFEQKNIVENILAKKSESEYLLKPEQVVDKIANGATPVHNMTLIRDTLKQEGTPEALQSWNSIRRSAIEDHLINPATKSGNWDSKAFIKNYDKMQPELLDIIADNPRLAGQLRLLRSASQYNLDSSKLLSTKVVNLLRSHISQAALGTSLAGGLGITAASRILSGDQTKTIPTEYDDMFMDK